MSNKKKQGETSVKFNSSPQKKRRSGPEIKKEYQAKRNKLYKERKKILSGQAEKNISDIQKEKLDQKLKNLNDRIDRTSSKIFRYGKKYGKLKTERVKLLLESTKIKKILKSDHSMGTGDRNKLLSRINKINSDVRDLSVLMKKNMIEQKSGKIEFITDYETDESIEVVTIWEARQTIEDLINSNKYDFLIIEDEKYSLIINKISALWAVDDFITDVTVSQNDRAVKTPMIKITVNNLERTIKIESI